MWKCDLKSNMGRHCLITSQWCKLLIDVREIIDNDNDSQGTIVHSAWWNRCFDVKHHIKSFSQRPMMSTCRRKQEICHWCMQASRHWKGASKSTSWIICWCRQEVTHRSRAFMYPPSTTRNEFNDFEDKMWLTTQCSGMVVMKMKVYEYCKGWSLLSDFSWTCQRHWMNWQHWPKTKLMDDVIEHR